MGNNRAKSVVETDFVSGNGLYVELVRTTDSRLVFASYEDEGQKVSIDNRSYSFQKRLLEQFHKLCSVSGVKKEALAVDDGDSLEGRFGSHEQIGFRSRGMTAENLLDFAPHRFDGIEVWRIRRQIQKPGALGLDGFADSPDFVRC